MYYLQHMQPRSGLNGNRYVISQRQAMHRGMFVPTGTCAVCRLVYPEPRLSAWRRVSLLCACLRMEFYVCLLVLSDLQGVIHVIRLNGIKKRLYRYESP
jgi:hypothetical protein